MYPDGNGPSIVETKRGLSLFYRGLYLYSSRDPERSPRQIIENSNIRNGCLYFIPSPCLLHGMPELRKKLPKDSFILTVETDTALYEIAAKRAKELGMGDSFLLIHSRDRADILARVKNAFKYRRVEMLILNAGYKLDEGFYSELYKFLAASSAGELRNRVALDRMGRLWTRNLFSALARMDWQRVILPEKSERPVAVCGAGPSLDNAIPLLKKYNDSIAVMASDSAWAPLVNAGIRVDDFIFLEGQLYNLEAFSPRGNDGTVFWGDLCAHPSSWRASDGCLGLTASIFASTGLHRRLAMTGLPLITPPPLGSVGVLALHLARQLYSGPIFTTGLDFSWPSGKSHAIESPAMRRQKRKESRLYRNSEIWAMSYREGGMKTPGGWHCDPALKMYSELAESEILDGRALGIEYLSLEDAGSLPGFSGTGRNLPLPEKARAKDWKAKAGLFLKSEKERIDRLGLALREGTDSASFIPMMEECDWCWVWFPDPERLFAMELDALKRLALEAAYWSGRLELAMDIWQKAGIL